MQDDDLYFRGQIPSGIIKSSEDHAAQQGAETGSRLIASALHGATAVELMAEALPGAIALTVLNPVLGTAAVAGVTAMALNEARQSIMNSAAGGMALGGASAGQISSFFDQNPSDLIARSFQSMAGNKDVASICSDVLGVATVEKFADIVDYLSTKASEALADRLIDPKKQSGRDSASKSSDIADKDASRSQQQENGRKSDPGDSKHENSYNRAKGSAETDTKVHVETFEKPQENSRSQSVY